MTWIVAVSLVLVIAIAIYDLTQRQHAILRTFPIIGHVRYWLEATGPELRQYIVTDNDEERPFSRDQRRWIYASAKRESSRMAPDLPSDSASPLVGPSCPTTSNPASEREARTSPPAHLPSHT